MSEELTNQYPAWQEEIRAAQTAIRKELAAEEMKSLEQAAWLDLRLGALLEGALELYGIELSETPTVNEVTLDRIRFIIDRYSKNADGTPALLKPLANGNERYEFDLEVVYALEGEYAKEHDRLEQHWAFIKTLSIRHDPDNPDWEQEKAQLADAIDEVTRDGQAFMVRVDGWKALPASQPTPEEQLTSNLRLLIRQIIREETSSEDAW